MRKLAYFISRTEVSKMRQNIITYIYTAEKFTSAIYYKPHYIWQAETRVKKKDMMFQHHVLKLGEESKLSRRIDFVVCLADELSKRYPLLSVRYETPGLMHFRESSRALT